MNSNERKAKIDEIKGRMKATEKSKEFWNRWTSPLGSALCIITFIF